MIIIRTLKEWCERLHELLASGELCFAVIVHPQTEVAYGWDKDVDLEYCAEHGIPAYNQNRNGGTIVCAKGNIGLGVIYDNRKTKEFAFVHLMEDLVKHFQDRGLNVSFDHNDILIDGYKVASACGYNLPPDYKRTYEGVQISVNQDIGTIEAVCKKKMGKEPKALSDYGFTTDGIFAWVTKWLSDYFEVKIEEAEA